MKKNWNWFKNEQENKPHNIPVQHSSAQKIGALQSPASYFNPLASFYQNIDRMFENAFQTVGLPDILANNNAMPAIFTPNMDIASTAKQYSIEVEVPGMSEDDIQIDLSRDGQLCICGEKRLENERQEKDFYRVERSYGSFSRTLSLPQDVDQDNVEASFNNGVLTITAPRLASSEIEGRRIEVKKGEKSKERRTHDNANVPLRSQNAQEGRARKEA